MTWIHTFTGKVFDLLEPQPDQVCIEDIAHALSQICRYTGHSLFPYSVAQHCVVMSEMVEPEHALWALLHDAPEAYLNDLAAPIKRLEDLRGYRELEKRVAAVVARALEYKPDTANREAVRNADLRMLLTEAMQLLPWPPPRDWGIDAEPYDIEIEAWESTFSESMYLDRFTELTAIPTR